MLITLAIITICYQSMHSQLYFEIQILFVDGAPMILVEMQHEESHNQLQHDLTIEMWAKWSNENGPPPTDSNNNLVM